MSKVQFRIIKKVSEGTKKIVLSRARHENLNLEELFTKCEALGIIHCDVCDMIFASDLAEKAASVSTFEITGTCPQHMTCLGILGDTAAVEAAVRRITEELPKEPEI